MTNVTKVIRPFPEGYVRENALQGETLAGAMFSVTPRAEFVNSIDKIDREQILFFFSLPKLNKI